ncbi:glyoxylate reductase [Thermotomaculum hydrothermale]|uniref:Glyoxylate reductase n=1 Tax=Thermotomaculum hydrothermale TaxID=981385 RepID=A0A7R6PZ86_9BACT|nr:D-glycerate dehydrogenase [Thermotomaculum hydrothermale]BBB33665.1 glyoxylate reductase [Thermotomaculum hydrothermale]
MKVFVTKKIPEIGINYLKERGFEVNVREEEGIIPDNQLIEALKKYDGIISMLSDNLSKEVLKHAEKTRVISNYAVGYNNIDVEYAREKGIIVTNTPDVLTYATAELAFGLMLSASRRIVEGDRFTREGKFKGWEPLLFLGKTLDNATVGIVGMGRIGQKFAEMLSGFNVKIIYYSKTKKDLPYKFVDFETLLKESDLISLHLPLTKESKHMFTENEFEKMKDGVVFINTARGAIVKESDLIKALKKGKIAFAGLDVYEFEPEISDELKKMQNVVILPHIGSATEKARNDMSMLVAKNIEAVLRGGKAITPVNQV